MRFSKSILKVGKYRSPDGEVDVTPERLKHWVDQFAAMTKANQVIPIDWDHADSEELLRPIALADYQKKRSAKNTVGHLADVRLAPDGQSAEITLDIADKDAIGKAEKNTVYVSPVLFPSWKDGAGNEYQDCFTHVDLVNHPVDHSQGPFVPSEPGTIACAIRMGLSQRPFVRLAEDRGEPIGYFDRDGDTVPIFKKKSRSKKSRGGRKRKKGRRMSLVPFYRFAEDEEDENEDFMSNEDEGGSEDMEEQIGESYDDMDEILDLLEQNFNIVLPDDTTDENVWDRLKTALLTAAAHRGGNPDSNAGPGAQDMNTPTTVADPGFAALSLQARAAISWAEQSKRDQLQARLDKCLDEGRCSPADFQKHKQEMAAVKLSLDKSGKPIVSELEKWLNDRETIPQGTFWEPGSKLRRMEAATAPTTFSLRQSEPSESEIDEAVNFALGRKVKAS